MITAENDPNSIGHRIAMNKNIIGIFISIVIIIVIAIFGISFVIHDVKAQSLDSSLKTSNNNNNNNNNNATIIKHYHSILNISLNGKHVPVPSGIGINQSLWKDHSLDKYGMQSMPMTMPGMAPLHTMDNSGNITVDSSVNRIYTLGEFFKIWGVDFNDDGDKKKVEVTIDGKPVHDFKNYVLKDDDKNHHLTISLHGKPISIPAFIGIKPALWKYHSLDKYGMQAMNMTMPGMAPLHTHDSSGFIHIESNKDRSYTFGQFLKIWGLDLNGKTVKLSADGNPISNFRSHILKNMEHITLDIRG